MFYFFFFSSRRRHTRCSRDWSSDVCSSDLETAGCYYGNNSGTVIKITLPNTKLGIFIPLMSCYMSVGGSHEHDAARGVLPNFPVKRTIADLVAGVDTDLELALELFRKGRCSVG